MIKIRNHINLIICKKIDNSSSKINEKNQK